MPVAVTVPSSETESSVADVSMRTPAPVPRRLVRCVQCGRADECSPEELLRYTREGWPRCCGQVMALLMEFPNHGSYDTSQ